MCKGGDHINQKHIELISRVGIFGEFLGHGIFAVGGKPQWIEWIQQITGLDTGSAANLLLFVGVLDISVACITLLRPVKLVLLWATFWGFWTALLRPLVGEPIWDFVERWANWAAPLALLFLKGWPKNIRQWFL